MCRRRFISYLYLVRHRTIARSLLKRFRDETQAVNKLARFVSNLHLPAFARLQATVDCTDHCAASHRSFRPCGLVIQEGQTVVIDARFFVPIQMKKVAGHLEAPTMAFR